MPNQIAKFNPALEALSHLGLGQNEAELYLIMLKHPRSTVQELQRKSPFPRTMLYYILHQLTQLGLVSAQKEDWRTTYLAEDPERLYDVLAERERTFKNEEQLVREVIPSLKQSYRLAGKRPGVRVFDGLSSYEQALDDVLLTRPDNVLSYRQNVANKKPGREIRETYEHKRIAKKITQHTLVFDTPTARQELSRRPYDDFTQFRFIDKKIKPFNAEVDIYQGKMLYTTYGEHEPSVLLIEDQALNAMQANLFNVLWENALDMTLFSFNKFVRRV